MSAKSMKWSKHKVLGKGTFGTVYLAKPINTTSLFVPSIAVKSCDNDKSFTLQNEGRVLKELRGCQEIIQCFGEDISTENGKDVFNLLLEYAPGGTLLDLINFHGGKLPESDVQWYTYLMLKALCHIHRQGYVHCDIKPGNILVFPCDQDGVNYLKIADFGLAKRAGDGSTYPEGELTKFRGTAAYTSPESIACNQQEAPNDIWSLGCTIVEMITGKPAWRDQSLHHLLYKIGFGEEEMPEIPEDMSRNGKDFLIRCLERNPGERWTAARLLKHPFIVEYITSLPQNLGEPVLPNTNPFGSTPWFFQLSMFSISSEPQSEAEYPLHPPCVSYRLDWSEIRRIN